MMIIYRLELPTSRSLSSYETYELANCTPPSFSRMDLLEMIQNMRWLILYDLQIINIKNGSNLCKKKKSKWDSIKGTGWEPQEQTIFTTDSTCFLSLLPISSSLDDDNTCTLWINTMFSIQNHHQNLFIFFSLCRFITWSQTVLFLVLLEWPF